MEIKKGMKFMFHSARPKGLYDGFIFVVAKLGKFSLTLKNDADLHPLDVFYNGFQINYLDFQLAIKADIYTLIPQNNETPI